MKTSRSRRGVAGFTLIELMIVVSIIGILAAIAIPKFAEMVRKSKEGATKGHMGAVRSALAIYYADMEGNYPTDDLTSLTVSSKYISHIPAGTAPNYHPASNVVDNNDNLGCGMIYNSDNGRWVYWNDTGAMCGMVPGPPGYDPRYHGNFWMGCSHTDIKGTHWTEY